MNKHTKAFVEYVEEVSAKNDFNKRILEGAILKSKDYKKTKTDPDLNWSERKTLMRYKDDLLYKWNFILDTEDRFDIKKVNFWDVMDYFCEKEI